MPPGTFAVRGRPVNGDGSSAESDDARGLVLAGTMTFGADSSFATTVTLSGTVVRSSYRSVRCTGASTCTCRTDLVPTTASGTGTYVKATNLVTISYSDGSVETDSYCVSGDTLTFVKYSDPTSGILTLSRAQ